MSTLLRSYDRCRPCVRPPTHALCRLSQIADKACWHFAGRLDTALVEKWCRGAKENATLGAVRNVVRAFRAACPSGDPQAQGAASNLRIMSDAAFQRVLIFTLTEADTFFRRLLNAPPSGALADSTFTGGRCAAATSYTAKDQGHAFGTGRET